MTLYTCFDFLSYPDYESVGKWISTCVARVCIKPAESEWVLFQVDSEFVLENMTPKQFAEIMRECQKYLKERYDHSISPAKNMQRFMATVTDSLPLIPYKGSNHSPEYVTVLVKLDVFIGMLERSSEFLAASSFDPTDRPNVINRLSDPVLASELSRDMAGLVCLGREYGPRQFFWLSDATKRFSGSYFDMDEEELRDLIEASGLPWCLKSGKLEVVAIQIPLKDEDWDDLRVPTTFHSTISYFKPNKEAERNWGRTVDKKAWTSKTGLPELLHKSLLWKSTFVVSYVGCLTEELIDYQEDDWDKLLANAWNERKM